MLCYNVVLQMELVPFQRISVGMAFRFDPAVFPVPPEFLVPLADVTCDSGESITLRCKVCGRPRASVTWKGPNQSILTNNGRCSIAYRYV